MQEHRYPEAIPLFSFSTELPKLLEILQCIRQYGNPTDLTTQRRHSDLLSYLIPHPIEEEERLCYLAERVECHRRIMIINAHPHTRAPLAVDMREYILALHELALKLFEAGHEEEAYPHLAFAYQQLNLSLEDGELGRSIKENMRRILQNHTQVKNVFLEARLVAIALDVRSGYDAPERACGYFSRQCALLRSLAMVTRDILDHTTLYNLMEKIIPLTHNEQEKSFLTRQRACLGEKISAHTPQVPPVLTDTHLHSGNKRHSGSKRRAEGEPEERPIRHTHARSGRA